MKTIYKYTLSLLTHQRVEVPAKGVFISAQIQHGKPCVWAIIDTDNAKESVDLFIVGTGTPMPTASTLLFIGTLQQEDGYLVWHVFRGVK